MSINDGDKATAANLNAAYMSKTVESTTVEKVNLADPAAVSGSTVTNAQREHNGSASFSGRTLGGLKDQKPGWTASTLGSPTDDLFVRTNILTAQADINTLKLTKVPVWQKVSFDFSNLATAGLTNDIEIFSLPLKGVLHQVVLKHTTAFSGGSISDYSLSLGLAGVLEKYTEVLDVFQATGDTVFECAELFEILDFGSTTSVRLSAIAVGDNLDQAAAGAVDIWLKTSLLP